MAELFTERVRANATARFQPRERQAMTTLRQHFSTTFRLTRPLLLAVMLMSLPGAAAGQSTSDTPIYMREFDAFKNKTLEQKVQELADREEIRELIAAYAARVARGVPFTDLFTDDGAYITVRTIGGPAQEVRGRKNLEEHFKTARAARGAAGDADNPLPMIHNYLIRINGDEGTGLCSNELRITENRKSIIASGYYEDRYRRVNGHWKFAERKITWFHWVPLQEGWAKPKAQ
jgi:hypothetical protein